MTEQEYYDSMASFEPQDDFTYYEDIPPIDYGYLPEEPPAEYFEQVNREFYAQYPIPEPLYSQSAPIKPRKRVWVSNRAGLIRFEEWRKGDSKIACVGGNVFIARSVVDMGYHNTKRIMVNWHSKGGSQNDIPNMLKVLEHNEDAMAVFINYLLLDDETDYQFDLLQTIVDESLAISNGKDL